MTQAPFMFGAKKHYDSCIITVPSGRKIHTVFLGRGKFSNVFYAGPSRVYIFTQHGDLSKDIMSHVELQNNPHIPPMRYLGRLQGAQEIDVYKTKYYRSYVRANVDPETIRTVLELRMLHKAACNTFVGDIIAKDQCIDFNFYIAEKACVPRKIKDALMALAESAQDWGKHYLFDDFRNKNLALDTGNRLILIDPMFDAEKLQKMGK